MFDFWPFKRRRKVERLPLISELEEEKRAQAAVEISKQALQRTLARGPAISQTASRQAELRDQNHFTDLFIKSIKRS